MAKETNMKLITKIVQGIFFTSRVFQLNVVERCNKCENTKNGVIPPWSQIPRSGSYRRVKLRGVDHTEESSSAEWIIVKSQAPRCASHCSVKEQLGVKIKIFVSLWLLLKGQSGEILLGMNTYIIEENI